MKDSEAFRIPFSGAADVYLVPLGELSSSQVPVLSMYLDEYETERLARYRHESDKLRFAVGRHLLRLAASRIHGCDPSSVKIALESGGRPFLRCPASPLKFSISHSEDFVCIALSNDSEIGIDVECAPKDIELEALMACHFHENEKKNVLSCSGDAEKRMEFTRIWTRKEALAKAIGCGLSEKLSLLDLSASDHVEYLSSSLCIRTRRLSERSFLSVAISL